MQFVTTWVNDSLLEYSKIDIGFKAETAVKQAIKGDYRTTSSVYQMLHDPGWCDLKDRRRDLRLALLYKIVTGHVAINPDHIGLVAAECGQQDQSKPLKP